MWFGRWSAVETEVHGGIFVLTDKTEEYKFRILFHSVSLFSVWLGGAPGWVTVWVLLVSPESSGSPQPWAWPHTLSLLCTWQSEEQTSAAEREILGITPLCLWPKAHWSSPLKWGKMSTGKKGFASQKLFPDTWQWDQGEDWIVGNAGRQGEEARCSSRQNVLLQCSPAPRCGFFQWKMHQHPWWCYWNVWVLVNVSKSRRSLLTDL